MGGGGRPTPRVAGPISDDRPARPPEIRRGRARRAGRPGPAASERVNNCGELRFVDVESQLRLAGIGVGADLGGAAWIPAGGVERALNQGARRRHRGTRLAGVNQRPDAMSGGAMPLGGNFGEAERVGHRRIRTLGHVDCIIFSRERVSAPPPNRRGRRDARRSRRSRNR